MQRQIETRNFLAVYFAVSSQNGESPLRDVYQRPEQSRATVPGKNKSAWPKSMPGRLSALMYVRHRSTVWEEVRKSVYRRWQWEGRYPLRPQGACYHRRRTRARTARDAIVQRRQLRSAARPGNRGEKPRERASRENSPLARRIWKNGKMLRS